MSKNIDTDMGSGDQNDTSEQVDTGRNQSKTTNKRVLLSKNKSHGTPKLYSYINLDTKDKHKGMLICCYVCIYRETTGYT